VTGRSWRFALASAVGTSHERTGAPCQDASACRISAHAGASLLVAVVADGAGSARFSEYGARIACDTVREAVQPLIQGDLDLALIDRAFAEDVLLRLQTRIRRVARRSDAEPRDFACTLLAAFVGTERSAFLQIGDGAIVVSRRAAEADDPRRYEWVFWPNNGEFANETVFATSRGARRELEFATCDEPVDEIALFSDGLQGLVLDQRRQRAHTGFFEPMFASVRKQEPGFSPRLSRSLEKWLGSRTVVSRTDDDKSLILASRRLPAPPPVRPSVAGDPFAAAGAPDRPHGKLLR